MSDIPEPQHYIDDWPRGVRWERICPAHCERCERLVTAVVALWHISTLPDPGVTADGQHATLSAFADGGSEVEA